MLQEYLFLKKNFIHIPVDTNWDLLHNITINLESEEVKLYFFNSSIDFIYKYAGNQEERQYDVYRNGLDLFPLSKFFGHKFNLDDIIADTADIHHGIYFLSLTRCSVNQYIDLFEFILDRYSIKTSFFLEKINFLNNTSVNSLSQCYEQNCLDVIRLSIHENKFKVYARTFRYHHFDIPDNIRDFLTKALDCTTENLFEKLETGGVSYDFSDGRLQIFTQNEAVKSLRYQ